jgi:hypothetical protein
MKIEDDTKEGDTITCTTFPITITYMLKYDASCYLTIPVTPRFDLDSLIQCRFIQKTSGIGPIDPDIYL